MASQVLTPLQQKLSFSSKKKPKQKIRNVLATPFSTHWPLINDEDSIKLRNSLKENLVKLKNPKPKIPWSELKDIPIKDRKEFRANYCMSVDPIDKNLRSNVALGVNEAAKLLEKKMASSVLITSEVEPRLMVKHVVDLAVLHNTPLLIVPNLKTILKEHIGINSMVLAFKLNAEIPSNYSIIIEEIKEIYTKHLPPEKHINFNRIEAVEEAPQAMDVEIATKEKIETIASFKNCHLRRQDTTQRVFVPELSTDGEATTVLDKTSTDLNYIPIGDIKVSKKEPTKPKVSYKSLIVKRVTGNKDRNKKKIDTLKRKKR